MQADTPEPAANQEPPREKTPVPRKKLYSPEGRFRDADGRRFDFLFSDLLGDPGLPRNWFPAIVDLERESGAMFVRRRSERGTFEPAGRPCGLSAPPNHVPILTHRRAAVLNYVFGHAPVSDARAGDSDRWAMLHT